uniref:GLIPR1-like protein 1 n=2 Tax=Schistocephalus solidus TaxID=70667 RepID=A0A0X3NH22_SCHSO
MRNLVSRSWRLGSSLITKMQSPGLSIHAFLLLFNTMGFGLEQEYIDIIMEYHSLARSSMYPFAANMKALVYDTEAERLAQEWANMCQFHHPPWDDPVYGPYGQNLAYSSPRDVVDSLHIGLISWYEEKIYYRIEDDYCAKSPCTHYTAMIWANTSKIGCAYNRCDNLGGKNTHYWVCQYWPKGNYIGDKIYEVGRACSKCRPGQKCKNRQCV